MPYARLDDRWDDHRKIRSAWRREPAAVALHAMAICYCNRHITDGIVDRDWVAERLAALPFRQQRCTNVTATLLQLGLFEEVDEQHYRVHDFLDWNLSRSQREALSQQGRAGGLAKAKQRPQPPPSDGQAFAKPSPSQGLSQGSSTPTPTPTPTPKTSSSDASGADVKVTDDDKHLCALLRDLAAERNPKFKVKSSSRWLTDMRLLRANDGNGPADIERAIRWVFRDAFWGGVIQSPGNLRENFPKIWDRMHQPTGKVVPLRRESPSDIWVAINGPVQGDRYVEGEAS